MTPEAEEWFLEWQRCAGRLARTRETVTRLCWLVTILVVLLVAVVVVA